MSRLWIRLLVGGLGLAVGSSVATVALAARVPGGLAVALVSLGAAVVAGVLALRLSRPVQRLAESARRLGEGEFETRLASGGSVELQEIARSMERARAQIREQLESLGHERNRLRAILGSMAEGVVAVDSEERIVHVNEVAGRLLDLASHSESALGRRLLETVRQAPVLEAASAALEEGRAVRTQFSVGDGADERFLELNAAPLRNGADERGARRVDGAVLVLHDVTQLRRLEGIRRDFVSNVSHELKTPLTAIRGFVETMLGADDLDEDTRRRFLQRIAVQTSRLTALVSDLLSLSRVEAADGQLEEADLDLRAPLLESLRALQPAAESRDLEIVRELPSAPVLVRGDDEALRQAFSNLIDNAVKYSENGRRIWVLLAAEGGAATVTVRDEGPGINQEQQDRIFERFYRVDRGRSREVGGTGLGLAIVKNVAQASGGRVELESAVGRGSTFRIVLPLAPGATP